MALPFEDSRRLTGGNLFFASPGAVLDVPGPAVDAGLLDAWRAGVERAAASLGWPLCRTAVRRHARGTTLAVAAPIDQLFLATEVNEWALCAAFARRDPSQRAALESALAAAALEEAGSPAATGMASAGPPVLDEGAALARFRVLSGLERNPELEAVLNEAAARGLNVILDDTELTVGAGAGGRSFAVGALPAVAAIPWGSLHDVPTALVTGSNGKTTTVRLLAACARAAGLHAGYNCTDGVFIDDDGLAAGDYSGPAGARMVMRSPLTQAAILETARGGILRRGIAVAHADVAVVTNVSADHFGEYGVDDLAGLAAVKLSVAGAVAPKGLLVLNADDEQLLAQAPHLAQRFGSAPRLAWFALDADQETLRRHRSAGGATCGVRDGRLRLHHASLDHDLGAVADLPLSVGGVATYNIANLAAAALGAVALGIGAATIAAVFRRFGSDVHDNPGRLMRFDVAGVVVLVDYAHNPDGLRGLLTVASHLRGGGRLGLLLGHAGNRRDADIEEVAAVAARFAPDLVVIKENETQLRGRPPGEVPRIIHAALLRLGLKDAALPICGSEVAAAQRALDWARKGDVLAMPVHSSAARTAVVALARAAATAAAAVGATEALSAGQNAPPTRP